MNVTFKNQKLQSLYELGLASNAYNLPQKAVYSYIDAVDKIIKSDNILDLAAYIPFRFHPLHGKKEGIHAIRINNQGYRIELEMIDAYSVKINDVSLHYGD
jgi:plasmid maintenance system killer protein